MQTNRNEFYIKRDFAFYDSGILGCLPNVTFDVYEILRRWVWRSLETGDPVTRKLYAENKLATKMSQAEIADALDRDRKTINGHISGMKELGWIRVIPGGDHEAATYVLGERVRDSSGRVHEVFFADAWMKTLWDRLEVAAEAEQGETWKVTRMSWDRRRQVCQEYLSSPEGSGDGEAEPPSGDTGEEKTEPSSLVPVSRKMDRGCPENGTPVGERCPEKSTQKEEKSSVPEASSKKRREEDLVQRAKRVHDHWDKPSRRSALSTPRPANPDSGNSAAAAPGRALRAESEGLSERLEGLKAVAEGRMAAGLDPKGETYLAKQDRAHEAAKRKAEAVAAKRNRKSEDDQAIKEAHGYLRRVWEAETASAGTVSFFGPKEYEQVDALLPIYTQAQLASMIFYAVRSWGSLRKRVLKSDTSVLTFTFIWRFHALLMAEAQDFEKLEQVHREWKEWFERNPNDFPPQDLSDRHEAALPKLKALGLAS